MIDIKSKLDVYRIIKHCSTGIILFTTFRINFQVYSVFYYICIIVCCVSCAILHYMKLIPFLFYQNLKPIVTIMLILRK